MTDVVLERWSVGELTCVLWKSPESENLDGGVLDGRRSLATTRFHKDTKLPDAKAGLEGLALALAASEKLPRGPWFVDKEPITDVAMIAEPADRIKGMKRLSQPVQIARDLEIIPVSDALRDLLYQACDAPGIREGPVIDLRGQPLYAFVRTNAPREPLNSFDSDHRLQTCIALSRLVRPTSASFRYSARVIGRIDGERRAVYPGPVHDFLASAWTPEPTANFLSGANMLQLRSLQTAWDESRPVSKTRVVQAFWIYQYAAHTYLVDMRWQFIATALETLLATSTQSTGSFVRRVPLLAEAVGLPPVSKKEARSMWGMRNKLVHGALHGGLNPDDFSLYCRMEEILRTALRECVLSLPFRAKFETPQNVDAAFPLPAPAPETVQCPHCRTSFILPAR